MKSYISSFTKADLAFAIGLTSREKWGHLPADFERLFQINPEGCFIAHDGDVRAGIITTISYDDYAFMGNLIVNQENRGRGIGYALMKHAIAYLDSRRIKTIELDGVFAAVSMYRDFGFMDKYLSLRFFRRPTISSRIKDNLPGAKINDILEYDQIKTGIKRGDALRRFLEEFKNTAYCAGGDNISGYTIVRKREGDILTIAPLVADNRSSAEELLTGIIDHHQDQTLTIGIPAVNKDGVDLVRSLGFNYNAPSLRMYRGSFKSYEDKIFGILGPDIG